MKLLITTFVKTHWVKLTSVFFFVALSLSYINTFAVFTPGQTLDPSCAPGDSGCYVSGGGGGSGDFSGSSGGQTLNGGTAASENLTLSSTTHATKGKILFGTSAYDEVNNRLGVGTSTFDATNPEKLLVAAGTTSSVNLIKGTGSINNYLQLNIQNTSAGIAASTDIVATADNGSESTGYIDMGINSSGNTAAMWGAANDAYLYNMGAGSGGKLYVGTGTAAKSVIFNMGGSASTNEYMRIDGATGSVVVGAGTANSTNIFQVTKTNTLSSNAVTGILSNPTVNRTTSGAAGVFGITSSPIIGSTHTANLTASGTNNGFNGIKVAPSITNGATGTITKMTGINVSLSNSSAMIVSGMYGLYIDAFSKSGLADVTTSAGIAIPSGPASLGISDYALLLLGADSASGAWSIYDESGLDSYFSGSMTISGNLSAADIFVNSCTGCGGASLPSQTGNTGKFLSTDGSSVSWEAITSIPSQTGNTGKVLSTDGSSVSWQSLASPIPSQTGNTGKFLSTDGSSVSWQASSLIKIGSSYLVADSGIGSNGSTSAGNNNLFIGTSAGDLLAATTNNSNLIGPFAGYGATSISNSNFFGLNAGRSATYAANSNFFGNEAGQNATNAQGSNFFGVSAGKDATAVLASNFFGAAAGTGATNAAYSNFIGQLSGNQATNASYSNFFGFQVGKSFSGNNLGSNNIIIGTNISLPDTSANSINIGGVLFGAGTYATTSGNPSIVGTSTGRIGIGTYTFDATNPEKLLVAAGTTSSVNLIKGTGSINSYLQLNVQNTSSGTSASSDVVATADNGNETTGYIDMGINSSGNTSGAWGSSNDAYLYNMGAGSGGKLYIGTGTAAKSLIFMMGGSASTNEYMRIDGATGSVVVGGGTASSPNIFAVTKTSTSNTIVTGILSNTTLNRTANSSTRFVGIDSSPVIGATNTANFSGATATTGLMGIRSVPTITSGATGTVTRMAGISTSIVNNSVMNITLAYGLIVDSFTNSSSGVIDSAIGITIVDNSSIATNYTSILIGDVSPNTGVWSIYDVTEFPSYLGGNLGVGLDSYNAPAYTLDVGSPSVSGIVAQFTNSSGSCQINPTSSSVNCSSDINLKKNITSIADNIAFELTTLPSESTILGKISLLTPVSYNWKTELDTVAKHSGFIAQQVEQIFPDLVSTDIKTGLKSVNYMGFAPYTVQAIKEMDVKIKGLASLDTTNAGSLGSLIKQFFADQSQIFKEATIGILRINDQICVDDVCATKEEFKALLLKSKQEYGVSHQGQPDPTPDPIVITDDSTGDQNPPSDQAGDFGSQSEDESGQDQALGQ